MNRILTMLCALPVLAFAQASPEATQALHDIEAFTVMQSKTDPHYLAVEEVLLTEVDGIIEKAPARQWLPQIRSRYTALSEAFHAKERDAVRDEEARLARAPGASWNARYAQLEAQAKEGAISPRQHALHALEAARALAPEDAELISWRQAKVPLATAYELGTITRSEYEDRWAKTTTYFLDRQAANDRAVAQTRATLAAEEARLRMQAVQQSPAPRPWVRCRTTSAYGAIETRCF